MLDCAGRLGHGALTAGHGLRTGRRGSARVGSHGSVGWENRVWACGESPVQHRVGVLDVARARACKPLARAYLGLHGSSRARTGSHGSAPVRTGSRVQTARTGGSIARERQAIAGLALDPRSPFLPPSHGLARVCASTHGLARLRTGRFARAFFLHAVRPGPGPGPGPETRQHKGPLFTPLVLHKVQTHPCEPAPGPDTGLQRPFFTRLFFTRAVN